MSRIKLLAAFLLVLSLATAATLYADAAATQKAADEALQKLQGEWTAVSATLDGEPAPKEALPGMTITIKNDKATMKVAGDDADTIRLDTTQEPAHLDLIDKDGKVERDIYKLEGDKLTICANQKQRPTKFTAEKGSGNMLLVFTRAPQK